MNLSLFSVQEPATLQNSPMPKIIPRDQLCLKDICRSSDGLQTGPFGSQLHAHEYSDEGIPVVMPRDLVDGGISEAVIARVSPGIAERLRRHRLQPGDIILARRGEIGRCALAKPENVGWLCGTGCLRIRLANDISSEFVFRLISLEENIKWLQQNAVGQTMLNLGATVLGKLPLSLPPVPEQRRIVEILDEAAAAVRTMDALIAAKLKLKRAWAERLLTGRVRFPEFAGEAWQTRHLGEFFRDRNVRYKGEMPPLVLSCSKIHGIVPQTDLFSRVLASKDLGRYKFVEPGDLVFDPMLLWDASINFSTRTGVVSPAYSTLQFVAVDAEPRFFHYLFDSHGLRHVYKTISQGTNTRRKKATAADFLKITVLLPALPEQRKIAEVLFLMDEEMGLLRRQLAALKAQKQGLMQKLLTGEVRTRPDEPETEMVQEPCHK